jgi:hypothetical protein
MEEKNLPAINERVEARKKTRLGSSLERMPPKQKPLFFVNILIREKKYRQYCGEGLQKIRWLTDCAIYKYENETKKTNLGVAYGLKNENGNLCDLNSRIIDNLENGANVLVLLKEEYESEMRERKKSGGKGNTNLTDDFLRQLKQFNNGYKFAYEEEEDEEDEFVDQDDNEEDINDDQTLQKEMSQQQSEHEENKSNKNMENEEEKVNVENEIASNENEQKINEENENEPNINDEKPIEEEKIKNEGEEEKNNS